MGKREQRQFVFEPVVDVPCNVCGLDITERDIKRNNGAMRILNMAGYVHRRCKAQFDAELINGCPMTNLESMKDDLLGR